MNHLKRFTVAIMLCCVSLSAGAASLYVANNFTEKMYVINTDTVSGTMLGNSGVDLHFGGLGFANDGTLYGYSTGDPPTESGSLYTVNKTTGAWTLVGPSGTINGDSFDIDPTTNKAYVPSLSGAALYEIDLSTGLGTPVNLTGLFFSGSAFAPDGTFYITNSTGSVGGPLSVLDVLTGNGTFIGLLNIPEAITSLAFNPDDGFLYAVATFNTGLWRINPSNAVAEHLGLVAGLDAFGQYTMGTIQVAAVPAPTPAARDDIFSVDQDSSNNTLEISTNDVGFKEPLFVVVISGPDQGGTATVNGVPGPAVGITISYTPPSGFAGTETFLYQVEDIDGNLDTALVTISVKAADEILDPDPQDPDPQNDPAGPGGSGGCFIATAAYGSYLAPEVFLLREFRDRRLLTNAAGRLLVDWYYRISPPVAAVIKEHVSLRFLTRLSLIPLIYGIKHPTAAGFSLLASIYLLLSWVRRRALAI